jgi:hypothetical protein
VTTDLGRQKPIRPVDPLGAVMREGLLKKVAVGIVAMLGALPIVGTGAEPEVPLPATVREEVGQRLRQIQPKDAGEYVYRVTAAEAVEKLPGDLCLDLVYKIGHHQWSLVALRLERREGRPEVAVSEVVYGSAFGFVKNFLRSTEEARLIENGPLQPGETDSPDRTLRCRDFYRVRRGTMRRSEFDRLLLRGLTLWRSSISEVYVGPPLEWRRSGRRVLLSSSADGTILFRLAEGRPNGRVILKGDGTLIAGDLAERVEGGPRNYEEVRPHLFWEGFYKYLEKHPLSDEIPPDEAVPMLVARLKEPRMADGYREYYRRSLYVEVLGELGFVEAIAGLQEAAREPGIDRSWDNHLREDVEKALAKIEILSADEPTEELTRVLRTPDHPLASWALERIEQLPEEQRARTLLEIARKPDLKPATLRWILRTLAGIRRDDVRQFMSHRLQDADPKTRSLAATLLWHTWRDADAAKTLDAIFRGKGLEAAEHPGGLRAGALRVLLDPICPAGDIQKLRPAIQAELEKPTPYWTDHASELNRVLGMAILWNVREVLPAVERIVQSKSDTVCSIAIEALIRFAPDKARTIVSTMSVSDSARLQGKRALYAALLKIDEAIGPLDAESRHAEKQPPTPWPSAVAKRNDLAIQAISAGPPGRHAEAVLALVEYEHCNLVMEYLAIAYLRDRYPGDPQVQKATAEYLDRPTHRKLRSWFEAAKGRGR